jgi:hypothetical protein
MSLLIHQDCGGQIVFGHFGYKCLGTGCRSGSFFEHRLIEAEGSKYGDLVRIFREVKTWDEGLIKSW